MRTPPRRSITPAPFTITPARAARDTPERQRDRRCENQRAGRGDDEHCERADRVARQPPTPSACDPGGKREKEDRVAVREPDERRTLRLGIAHETDEGGIGTIRRGAKRANFEDVARVRRSAEQRAAGLVRRRKRLAHERGLVDTASPLTTIPSIGITSPARTTTTSPTSTSSTGTSEIAAPRRTCAIRGIRSTSFVSSRRARRPATSSSAFPPASMSAITASARYSPSASAPAIETSAIASTPTSPWRRDLATDQLSERASRLPSPPRRRSLPTDSRQGASRRPPRRP